MLKKLILVLAIALPASVFAQKFGSVKIEEVFTAMPESKAAEAQIAEASKKYEAEFQKLNDELTKLYTDFQAIQNDPDTPDTIKERRAQEIQERAANVDKFRATAQQDLQRQNDQLLAPIQQKLNDAITAVGQEGGFTAIIPSEGVFLYVGNDVVDVTPLVKSKLGI